MPPTLLLIRHAQALHNVASDYSIHDPPLSELGEQQCRELQDSLKNSKIGNQVELIVVSSMRRTLQTASLALDWLIKEGAIEVLPDAGWQGSPISTMAKEFPDFDFSKVDPLYPDKTSSLPSNPYAFTRRAILARGQACLQSLYSRSERVIAVVSHAGFLRAAVCNRRFANADWRIFEYDEDEMRKCNEGGDGLNERVLYLLKEWKETEERGGGMGRSEIGTFGPETVDFPVEVREEEAREVPTQMASREN